MHLQSNAYKPSKAGGVDDGSTEVGVAYTGIDEAAVKAAMGENNNVADSVDPNVFSAVYAAGPVSGYSVKRI